MLLLKWYLGGTGAFQKLTKHFIDFEPDTGSAAENKNGLIPFEKKDFKESLKIMIIATTHWTTIQG